MVNPLIIVVLDGGARTVQLITDPTGNLENFLRLIMMIDDKKLSPS